MNLTKRCVVLLFCVAFAEPTKGALHAITADDAAEIRGMDGCGYCYLVLPLCFDGEWLHGTCEAIQSPHGWQCAPPPATGDFYLYQGSFEEEECWPDAGLIFCEVQKHKGCKKWKRYRCTFVQYYDDDVLIHEDCEGNVLPENLWGPVVSGEHHEHTLLSTPCVTQ